MLWQRLAWGKLPAGWEGLGRSPCCSSCLHGASGLQYGPLGEAQVHRLQAGRHNRNAIHSGRELPAPSLQSCS